MLNDYYSYITLTSKYRTGQDRPQYSIQNSTGQYRTDRSIVYRTEQYSTGQYRPQYSIQNSTVQDRTDRSIVYRTEQYSTDCSIV